MGTRGCGEQQRSRALGREKAGAITLGFWGFFLLEFQLCSPQVWTHVCVPSTEMASGCSSQQKALHLLANTCTLGELSTCCPAGGRRGEVLAQKKHRFSSASAGGRRAAPAPLLGSCGFPCRCPTPSRVACPQRRCCVSECNHLSSKGAPWRH